MGRGGSTGGGRQGRQGVSLRVAVLVLVVLCGAGASNAFATHGKTTIKKTIVKEEESLPPVDSGEQLFFELTTGPGTPILKRSDLEDPLNGRKSRRRSLIYFAQLTDFQLGDEESPLRVEFFNDDVRDAWRPAEAFHAFALDQTMRRLNGLIRSPILQGDGERARMRLAVLTGDQSDNQQFNEARWIRQLIEPGSKLDPGSGIEDFSSCDLAAQLALQGKNLAKEPNYVGVQDYDDFFRDESYYDPDEPADQWINWPRYPGLMDRAQKPFITTGLKVPSYVVNGNHDALVQGNSNANQGFEQLAIGCQKVRGTLSTDLLDVDALLTPSSSTPVPPDPDRRIVSKGEVRQIFQKGKQKDDHGFAFIDSDEDLASRRTAWYYAWNPKPGFRFIVIDTVSEGGVPADSAEGNIDDPQFQWLERELEKATEKGKLIIVLGHHPIRSLRANTADEEATECAGGYDAKGKYVGPDRDPAPGHNHALHPGCDGDPRPSEPLHLGADLVELLHKFPRVIAYVPGHTHENCILPFPDGDGGGFWELTTSAVADWPQQNRVIDVMDNRDGTLSIFSVVTDHASNVGIPAQGNARSFDRRQLGALGRTFALNDPQSTVNTPGDPFAALCPVPDDEFASEGRPEDRNVELLIRDPRVPISQEAVGQGQSLPGQERPGEEGALGEQPPSQDIPSPVGELLP